MAFQKQSTTRPFIQSQMWTASTPTWPAPLVGHTPSADPQYSAKAYTPVDNNNPNHNQDARLPSTDVHQTQHRASNLVLKQSEKQEHGNYRVRKNKNNNKNRRRGSEIVRHLTNDLTPSGTTDPIHHTTNQRFNVAAQRSKTPGVKFELTAGSMDSQGKNDDSKAYKTVAEQVLKQAENLTKQAEKEVASAKGVLKHIGFAKHEISMLLAGQHAGMSRSDTCKMIIGDAKVKAIQNVLRNAENT